MTAVLGQWRASYAPGDWLVLAGPTSLVMLDSPAMDDPSLISALWDQVVTSSSMTDLAARLATYRLDTLPSLAAFFWTENGMRSLVRGSVSVLEVPSGRVLAQGEGIQTWTEVGLGEIRRVLVEPDVGGDDTGAELPLLIGAVRASSVLLDCTEEARVSSPQGQPEPLVAADSEAESATPEPEEPAEGPEASESADRPPRRIRRKLPATLDEEVPPALVGGLATEQMDDPFGDSERATARVEPEPPGARS